jgi:two-component system, OmpR family, response regulator AdeR
MKPKILISDDEPMMLSALSREAKLCGLAPIAEDSADRVQELARLENPDVIILDLRQNLDGRDVLARLKRDPATADVPVVVLTGVEDQFTRLVCLELGAHDYQTKPLDPTFMTRIARLALQRAEAQGRTTVH